MTCDPAQSRGSASSENSYIADVGDKYNPPIDMVHFLFFLAIVDFFLIFRVN